MKLTVLFFLTLLFCISAAAVGQDSGQPVSLPPSDPVRLELDASIATYKNACRKASESFVAGVKGVMETIPSKKLTAVEKLEMKKRLDVALEAFQQKGDLPADVELQAVLGDYLRSVAEAHDACDRAFTKAAEAYAAINLESLAKADAVMAERTAVLAATSVARRAHAVRMEAAKAQGAAKRPAYGKQLLANPGCEEGGDEGVLGWQEVEGRWQARSKEKPKDPEPQGKFFFAPRGDLVTARLEQMVDVSTFKGDITTGKVDVVFTGKVAALGPVASAIQDESRIVIQFLDGDSKVVDEVDFGWIHSPAWKELTKKKNLPASTLAIRVMLCARQNGGGRNNGYFDDLSLKLVKQ